MKTIRRTRNPGRIPRFKKCLNTPIFEGGGVKQDYEKEKRIKRGTYEGEQNKESEYTLDTGIL